MQMLGTHPDAFPHPSGLDCVEERPTSRSMCLCCVVWFGKEMDQSPERKFSEHLGFFGGQISFAEVLD